MKGLLYVSLSTSTVLQVEALQLDRDGQPVRRVDDDIISGYPSRPGCYFRQPSRCPARPMQTTMWRHDTWAEEHEVDEAGCKNRKGYWDRYCGAEDTQVVHIRGGLAYEPGPQGPSTSSDNDIVNGTPSEAAGAGAAAGGAAQPASHAPREENASEQVWEPGRPRVEQQAELGLARAPQSTWQWQNQQCLRCELCEWRCLGAHSSWEHQRCLRSCQWQPECRDCRRGTTGYHGGAPGWGPLARPASPGVGAAELALDGNIEPPDNISADDISVEMPAGLLP